MGAELTYYQIHSIHSREKLHSETSRCHTRTERYAVQSYGYGRRSTDVAREGVPA